MHRWLRRRPIRPAQVRGYDRGPIGLSPCQRGLERPRAPLLGGERPSLAVLVVSGWGRSAPSGRGGTSPPLVRYVYGSVAAAGRFAPRFARGALSWGVVCGFPGVLCWICDLCTCLSDTEAVWGHGWFVGSDETLRVAGRKRHPDLTDMPTHLAKLRNLGVLPTSKLGEQRKLWRQCSEIPYSALPSRGQAVTNRQFPNSERAPSR